LKQINNKINIKKNEISNEEKYLLKNKQNISNYEKNKINQQSNFETKIIEKEKINELNKNKIKNKQNILDNINELYLNIKNSNDILEIQKDYKKINFYLNSYNIEYSKKKEILNNIKEILIEKQNSLN